jgi:peptidoglycan/LPS O-acetylase OafA/YrhL
MKRSAGGVMRMDSLTGLRFIAALGVLVDHAQSFGISGHVVNPLGNGVSFFFVLSGFVLTWSWRGTILSFFRRRFARIYPAYAFCVLAAIGVGYVVGVHQGAGVTLRTLSLTQQWTPPGGSGLNTPLWTLSVEAFFYLTLPLWMLGLLRLSRTGRRIVAIVLIVIFQGAFALSFNDHATVTEYWWLYMSPWSHLPEFLLGMIAALEVRDGLRVPLSLAAVAMAIGCWFLWHSGVEVDQFVFPMPNGFVMIPFVLTVAAFAGADLRGWRTGFNSRLLVRLGTWSYALYLVHFLVYYLILQTTPHWPLWMEKWHWEVVVIVVLPCVVVSGLVHHLIEAPAERRLRGARPRADELAPDPGAGPAGEVPSGVASPTA